MVERGEANSHTSSVMNQLEDTSREIKECYDRLDFIETKLRRRHYPNEEKKRLEKEVHDIKTHLSRHENNLRSLRGENRVAMMLSVLILALGVMIYIVYCILFTS
ncbi:coiled-coil domain-containing protein 167-like [Homarus americanus]|uniref:Coiled-coil domain-containing protein 167 n=1 Tax=Homarus americanus TaxID=6706 RepID=A0A8J5K5P5_HOMAM|nr:coiled-coil domain-containing protein 167-like [Homarus americanus]KAG7167999.1 Coiled-coil domain-containing protein 167-like [Homarus americanus]